MNRFSTEWNEMVCHAWLTYEEAVEVARKAGYEQDPAIPNMSVVTDGEHSYALRFRSLTIVPGMSGLVWYWESEQSDNL